MHITSIYLLVTLKAFDSNIIEFNLWNFCLPSWHIIQCELCISNRFHWGNIYLFIYVHSIVEQMATGAKSAAQPIGRFVRRKTTSTQKGNSSAHPTQTHQWNNLVGSLVRHAPFAVAHLSLPRLCVENIHLFCLRRFPCIHLFNWTPSRMEEWPKSVGFTVRCRCREIQMEIEMEMAQH